MNSTAASISFILNYKEYTCVLDIKTQKNSSIKCADEVLYIPMLQQNIHLIYVMYSKMQRRSNEVRFENIFLKIFQE